MNLIHERDGGKCVVHGDRADSVHHRIHGNRADERPSNMLSVCGSGTTGAHGWIEGHWRAAQPAGWTVSKHGQDTTEVPVWYAAGPCGRGWYLLDDEAAPGFRAWPGSLLSQELGLDAIPPPEGVPA